MRALNAVLPDDVVFRLLEEAPERFDARHHAESKTYRYHILNGSLRAPMLNRFTWHVKPELDTAAFAEAAGMLIGQHDFAAFGAPTEGTPSTVRRIISATVNESRGLIRFSIRGTGFLRYMVRSIVGTLVPVGLGRITPRRFGEILRSCERNLARPTAPPHGLFLVRVRYPDGFADNLPEPYTLVSPHESETGVWEG
jgi:tRNA pseudouridine38-40 synthase